MLMRQRGGVTCMGLEFIQSLQELDFRLQVKALSYGLRSLQVRLISEIEHHEKIHYVFLQVIMCNEPRSNRETMIKTSLALLILKHDGQSSALLVSGKVYEYRGN